MGRVIARRLADTMTVRAWSRGPAHDASGLLVSDSLPATVDGADVVLLTLYDGPACRQVLSCSLPEMAPQAHVVNLATVGGSEALDLERLTQEAGRSYLHAPVIGSTNAAASGRLTVLAGGSPSPDVQAVLEQLGEVVTYDDARLAASAKLLAASVLADNLVLLRSTLRQAEVTGLSRTDATHLLRHTSLSGLVAAKIDAPLGSHAAGRADFTLGALRKDMLLAKQESGEHSRFLDVVDHLAHDTDVPFTADIAAAANAAGALRTVPAAHLQLAPSIDAAEVVLAPLVAYAMGHATGESQHFRRAFLPTARIEGLREGTLRSWDLDTYVTFFDGPADDEATRVRVIDRLDQRGAVATATMILDHGNDTFVDQFVLIKCGDDWRIANKVFERLSAGARHDVT